MIIFLRSKHVSLNDKITRYERLREIPNDREILIRDGNCKCYKLEGVHLAEERKNFSFADVGGWYTHFYCIFDLEK